MAAGARGQNRRCMLLPCCAAGRLLAMPACWRVV